MSDIFANFADFAGGNLGTARPVSQPADRDLAALPVAVPVVHINGLPVGRVAEAIFEVKFWQLELAPPAETLYSQYDPDADPHLAATAAAADAMGEFIDPLIVMATHRAVTFQGETLPCYRVYHDPVLYYALRELRRVPVRVRLFQVEKPGMILLYALSRHQHQRPLSMLERCDVAYQLGVVQGFDHGDIAKHLAIDTVTGEAPTDAYVSQLIRVSRLPAEVRQLLHRGDILFSHAREIAYAFGDAPERALLLARWVAQDGRSTVRQVQEVIKQLKPPVGATPAVALREDTSGRVNVVAAPTTVALPSAPVRPPPVPAASGTAPLPLVGPLMAARPAMVRSAMRKYDIRLIPHANPERIAVSTQSLAPLTRWLNTLPPAVPLRDIESELRGVLEAIRAEAARHFSILNGSIATATPERQRPERMVLPAGPRSGSQ